MPAITVVVVVPTLPSSPSSASTSTGSIHSLLNYSSSVIEFYPDPNLHNDAFLLGQPNDSSYILSFDSEAQPTIHFTALDDESSIDTALSSISLPSTNSNDPSTNSDPSVASIDDLGPPEGPAQLRPQVNPGRLNDAWRTFFRDSLVATDPAAVQVEAVPAQGGTPASLPPPPPPPRLSPPNEPSGDPFENKNRDSFRIWSVNANEISIKYGFAELHALCISLCSRSVDAIAIQEPNLDFMKADIRETYEAIFKEHFGQARVITATTCIEHRERGNLTGFIWKANSLPCAEIQHIDARNSVPIDELLPLPAHSYIKSATDT
jgi:hypothetical protein